VVRVDFLRPFIIILSNATERCPIGYPTVRASFTLYEIIEKIMDPSPLFESIPS